MGLDYYAILGIGRSASASAVNLAYRIVARACHPMRGYYRPEQMPIQTIPQWRYWEMIGEAYEVLSDAARRQVYDLHGEEGLQTYIAPDGTVGYTFSGDCDRIYSEAMAAAPSNDRSEGGRSCVPFWEKLTLPEPLPPRESLPTIRKCAPKVYILHVTLEDIFYGVMKTVVYHNSITHNGVTTFVDRTVSVPIKPGLLPGSTILFAQMGDQCDDHLPGDVVFEVAEIPHYRFKRMGPTLSATFNISLMQALAGGTLTLVGIDGKILLVELAKVCTNMLALFDGEGMPVLDGVGRGNLYVTFSVRFPRYIPLSDRQQLVQVLGNSIW
ncbi:dnaJ homolog subfamily B member 1-like [Anopheles bellator]|uniref:dnaJ homolog subfamily B member 1-like n=1 Tax=Anopheles bellator TaxID=139047 RepID=UPI0026473648|nr:dnaJ homolog subfamily B member 1-like [Anopheles bellator]